MAYQYAGVTSILGIHADLGAQRQTERLHALFAAGVPVVTSADGTSFTAAPVTIPRPPVNDWDASLQPRSDGQLGSAEW